MKHQSKRTFLIAAVLALVAPLFITADGSAASFAGNRIIDDKVFNNIHTMDANAINNFLNGYGNSCISPNRGFSAPLPTGYSPSGGYTYGGNASAGEIIATASHAYDINPQVLLVTLQKEQSLVTGDAGCSVLRYTGAMGYGCPDSGTTHSYSGLNLFTVNGVTTTSVSGTCVNSALKAGFSQQVIRGAWLLKFGQQRSLGNLGWAIIRGSWDNSDDPQSCYSGPMTQGTHRTCPSGAAIYYDGNRTIDGTVVYMSNGSTASLYWYTPHFHGNQNFFNRFTEWFGLPYSNDTDTAHPEGTLVSNGYGVYLIENNTRRHIVNPAVFHSHGYRWDDVKLASSGDNNLPIGWPINEIAAGTVFTTGDGKVYAADYFGNVVKKRWLSSESFIALGYRWSEIANYPSGEVLIETEPGLYTGTRHPAGTLIVPSGGGKIYRMDTQTLRHVLNPAVFESYNFNWNKVYPATAADLQYVEGAPLDLRTGTIMWSNGIYVVDYDMDGIYKRPVGPWECYSDRLHYDGYDWIATHHFLPSRTGQLFTC